MANLSFTDVLTDIPGTVESAVESFAESATDLSDSATDLVGDLAGVVTAAATGQGLFGRVIALITKMVKRQPAIFAVGAILAVAAGIFWWTRRSNDEEPTGTD